MISQKVKYIAAAAVAATGILGGTLLGVSAMDFAGHWAETKLTYLEDEDILGNLDSMEANTEITVSEYFSAASQILTQRIELDAEVSEEDTDDSIDDTDENTDDEEKTTEDELTAEDYFKLLTEAYNTALGETVKDDDILERQSAFAVISLMTNIMNSEDASDESQKSEEDENPYADILDAIVDSDEISDWAETLVCQTIAEGYAWGYENNDIKPMSKITWEEASSLFYNFGKNMREIGFPGTYELGEINGITISSGDVTLQNTIVNGDMYLHYGIAEGTVSLKNVTVTGTIYIQSPLTQLNMDANSSAGDIVQLSNVYADGVYTGKASGFRGTITVQVTIKDGQITDITVLSHSDDTVYMNKAMGLISSIISKQTTNIDTVSGATYSSKGLLAAVADALSQAAGTTENPGESSESQSTSTGSAAGSASATSGADSTSPSRIDYNNYVIDDGVWSGSATGYGGTLTVSVTVSGGVIKSVDITSHSETASYLALAKRSVVSSIVNKNSTNVDTVSGATYSSKAIMKAVENALKNHLTLKTSIKSWSTSQDETYQWYVTATLMDGTSASNVIFKLDGEEVTGTVSGKTITFPVSEENSLMEAFSLKGKLLSSYTIDFSKPYEEPAPSESEIDPSPSESGTDPSPSEGETDPNPSESGADPSPSESVSKVLTKTATVSGNSDVASYSITVNVSITDGVVTKVSLVSHTSQQAIDAVFVEMAIEHVNNQLPSSSSSYDTMCGATLSANAIVKAIQSALAEF